MSNPLANRRHSWLPKDKKFIRDYIRRQVRKARTVFRDGDEALHPFMKEWLQFIETDSQANIYFTNMFLELPEDEKEIMEGESITDYKTMIQVLDVIISEAPAYISNGTDIVGVPIYLVLNYLINTPGGQDAFMYDKVNQYVIKVLRTWQDYLAMTDSADVLNDGETGWLSPGAIATFEARDGKPFNEMYVCDQSQPHWGYGSWDHFFTRQLQTGARPLDDDPTHVVSACESAIFGIATNVQASDSFWLKKETALFGYPYSLVHMLNGREKYVRAFTGGTVYQAFLSPFDYHRWHSPVTGKIEKIDVLPGTYYAAVSGSEDPVGGGALVNSQSFLTAVAARAIFYINATSPPIGLVAFMAVGMAEVSTCHVTVRENTQVTKGQELGMFHFGGSSHILIFNKDTQLSWLQGIVDAGGNPVANLPVKINTGIAVASRKAPTY
ncbi:hypothetical protein BDN72DRAFT_958610 [Pluteus cervinus]|uniref:Uncharacterized protein n=1 Tax=Pluteus cervinus TaxID=181527 RepID=A0ACD3AZ36_9AGAR|nr:hypothetical protein BDN72DRAFT_958610 [Pluteus cervinus]